MQWRPRNATDTFPQPELLQLRAGLGERLFPLPDPPYPRRPDSVSSRLRARFKRKVQVWKMACSCVRALNALESGHCGLLTSRRDVKELSSDVVASHERALANILAESARLCNARRGEILTGADAVAKLCKTTSHDSYSRGSRREVPQVPLLASAIDEPSSSRCVSMLETLDYREAAFYGSEESVIEDYGKSQVLFHEIESHYGFVGGSHQEYVKYFVRSDLPDGYWVYRRASEVKSICGFSTVSKKDASNQRKLLMACSANYWWSDPRRRANHGLYGAGAFQTVHVESDAWAMAAFDQSIAFSFVRTPEWMWPWFAVPPLRAYELGDGLPRHLRDSVLPRSTS